jgi:hypothetical protein
MKRRQFISTATTLPLLALAACEKNLPSTPTIVTGKVTDENNLPVEGVEFLFYGTDKKGLSGIPTFDLSATSDKEGIYRFSQVIPNGTDNASILPQESNKFRFGIDYSIFFYKDGIANAATAPIEIERKKYGKENVINFQIRKK